MGRHVFTAVSIGISFGAGYRILNVPGRGFAAVGVGGRSGGYTIGRVEALYGSPRAGGVTLFSIVDNNGKSILRFVIQNGRLHVNGRIFGKARILQHETDWRKISKGILKLLWHGAKEGL